MNAKILIRVLMWICMNLNEHEHVGVLCMYMYSSPEVIGSLNVHGNY